MRTRTALTFATLHCVASAISRGSVFPSAYCSSTVHASGSSSKVVAIHSSVECTEIRCEVGKRSGCA